MLMRFFVPTEFELPHFQRNAQIAPFNLPDARVKRLASAPREGA
jgi:hypothetical protein